MLSSSEFEPYINKLVYIRTSSGLYVKLEEISENNNTPTFVLIPNKNHATEFILSRKSCNTVSIRINIDMKNQNGTFGYHLYTMPDTDTIYGSGNDEVFAQFNLIHYDKYIQIKSSHKDCYFCYEYGVMRCRNQTSFTSFLLEDIHIPSVQRSICIISYGFMKNIIDLKKSPIINTLKEIYPQNTLDIYIHSPSILDEFYNVTFDPALITADKCNVSIKTYPYDVTKFMKLSHFFNMPIISNRNKIYSYRTLSMFHNLSEAIKTMVSSKKVYTTYILLRNDSYHCVDLYKKIIDTTKLYCYNNELIDTRLCIGKDILFLSHIYDYFVKNRNQFADVHPRVVIGYFFQAQSFKTGSLCNLAPSPQYQTNQTKLTDTFYKSIYAKYKELVNSETTK